MNYYNDFDKKIAAWLKNLVDGGMLPPGHVDTRPIQEVTREDLRGYTQCHFFAGIGGWPLALRMAGWSTDVPVWTGSCPCQPFSNAGLRKGQQDERHLWPHFFRLIKECRPDVVFGEQVASAIGHGWLDGISTDLEAEDYACGSVVLGAHSVSAPHIRQRLYWVAESDPERCSKLHPCIYRRIRSCRYSFRCFSRWEEYDRSHESTDEYCSTCGWVAHGDSERCTLEQERDGEPDGRGERPPLGDDADGCGERVAISNSQRLEEQRESESTEAGHIGDQCLSAWDDYELIRCGDGKTRRIESGTPPLVDGVPKRVVLLRGYGNAIVPQVAAEFIRAHMDLVLERR